MEKMRQSPALLTFVVLSFFLYPAFCDVKSVEISPPQPVQGDTMTIVVKADPGEQISVQIRFKKDLQVSGGTYLLELRGVEVPQKPNSFSVKATNVKNLVVAVRLGIWISLSKEATNGVATMSQSDVPSGRYDFQVKGDAVPGASKVTLEVTARTTVTVGSDGSYSISYDTSSIPAGTFTVDVGGVTRTVTLSEARPVAPIPSPVPPVALFSLPSTPMAGVAGIFDASASSDADGMIVEYVWEMGDGTVLRGKVVCHVYSEPGTYIVTLTVADNVGLTGKRVGLIDVGEAPNRPPIPVVSTDRVCFVGQLVGFSALSSYDPDGCIVSYLWDFGGGLQAEGVTVNHRYESAGLYNASLFVTDEGGLSSMASIRVQVLSPPTGHSEWVEFSVEDGDTVSLPGQGGLIRLNSSGSVSILFFQYPGNPYPGDDLPLGQVGGFIDVSVGDPDRVRWPLYIEVKYDPSVVPAGDEDKLGLYYYSSGWLQCWDTDFKPGEGVVWARLRRDELRGSPLTIGHRSLIEGLAIRSLTLSSDNVTLGDEVTVYAEVVNIGGIDASYIVVLEVDGVAKAVRSIYLGSGERRFVSWVLSFNTSGMYQVGVGGLVRPLTVAESLPDLAVSGSYPDEVDAGPSLVLSFNVLNRGGAVSDTFKVGFYVDDVRMDATQVGSLPPGGSDEIEFTWAPTLQGVYSLRVAVDVDAEVSEADESNNELGGSVTVTGKASPDDYSNVLIVGIVAVAVMGLYLLRRCTPLF
jgi:PKD repeat protein